MSLRREFAFSGDDLWLSINGKLALDLGISIGNTYPMNILHAERHRDESNFSIMATNECFVAPPG